MKYPTIIIFIGLLSSCDYMSGEHGVVVDKSTNARIPNVRISFSANNGDYRETSSDQIGFFDCRKISGCGIKKCPKTWTMTFEKDSFRTTTIDNT